MASFKIGREFFAKAKADYADWRWSWVREICKIAWTATPTASTSPSGETVRTPR